MGLVSKGGHTELAKYLIENGSNINEKDNVGDIPLHMGKQILIFIILLFL